MELSITNSISKKLLIPARKAIKAYGMIEEGDRIAVGISGGKDSSTLLYILSVMQKQLPFTFEVVPISLSLGFEGMETAPLVEYIKALGLELRTIDTEISKVVFDIRQEKNPCSLCANLRRGTLYDAAKAEGCNKVALGHHLDDAIETFFMNLVFNGQMGTFQPKTYLDRTDITVIRPMIHIEEKSIINFVQSKGIPIIHNPCPADKKTKREEVKTLVKQLEGQYPGIREKFLHAVKHADLRNFWNEEMYR